MEADKNKPNLNHFDEFPLQKLTTFRYQSKPMSEEISKKLDFRLNLEPGLSDALNVYIMQHKSFELEFANLNRKTIKAWFENGMIKPALRE